MCSKLLHLKLLDWSDLLEVWNIDAPAILGRCGADTCQERIKLLDWSDLLEVWNIVVPAILGRCGADTCQEWIKLLDWSDCSWTGVEHRSPNPMALYFQLIAHSPIV